MGAIEFTRMFGEIARASTAALVIDHQLDRQKLLHQVHVGGMKSVPAVTEAEL